jgi:hypothetical protein
MNKSRKLLTLIALVAFVVILLVIGNNQYPYSKMQIEWGRGRVWGLTPLGNALSILFVVYLGLFVVLNDDRFLFRWRRTIIRVTIGVIVVAALAGLIVLSSAIIGDLKRKAERVAWDAKAAEAHQWWQQLSTSERASLKIDVRFGFIPDDPTERAKIQKARDFVPEVYEPLTEEEVKSRPTSGKYAALYEATPTPTPDIFHRIPSWAETQPMSDSQPSKVAADDLNKIILFDVGVEEGPSFSFRTPNRERSIREFHGRVRNELPRAVEAVVIKVYIYNTPRDLVETRKFRLYQGRFEPSAPVSFSAFQSIRHLPEHYFYQLQVDEARYAQ